MATMHPSADYRNATRTIMARLATSGLGADLVPAEDLRFDTTTVPAFVRVALQPMEEVYAGRIAGMKAVRVRALLVAECFVRSIQDQGVATVDGVDALASNVAHALRFCDLPLKDYIADSSGNTPVSGVAVRMLAPHVQHVDPDAGWDHRIVTTEASWHARHAE